ncbi:MAG: hypothetical protein K2O24_09415 [Muribaculaceae bacterium]|nr:hypothetical protein [Muribaculaceae bacterium]
MKHIIIPIAAFLGTTLTLSAHTTLFDQNFDGDWTEDFPTLLDLDDLPPYSNVNPLFMNSDGVSMPWWHLRDAQTSTDRFLCSHSLYQYDGASNDWVSSRPITIPSEGFNLTFGAQSLIFRVGGALSDLRVFITEEPISADNLPTEPVLFVEQVGEGKSADVLEGDFIPFEINLDKWAGKTIYISFANLNYGQDILAIDNVLVQRLDKAEITQTPPPPYVLNGAYPVSVTVKATDAEGLPEWTLTFDDGTGNPVVKEGTPLKNGESVTFDFTGTVEADRTAVFTSTLDAPGMISITAEGAVTGMAFMPKHRVLFEEATGTWCGNCPLGAYTVESMMKDEDMRDRVVPVSIHIPGNGNDYMINEYYASMFAVNSAPMVRLERDVRPIGFANADMLYDPSNPLTMAYAVRELSEKATLADISIEAWYPDGIALNEADRMNVKVTVTPAVTLGSNYAIGLVMTENNVFLPRNPAWMQENYFSGVDLESGLGGWTNLPKRVVNYRFQDVARGVWGYRGGAGSLPELLPMGVDQVFETPIDIPDTLLESGYDENATVISPAINRENVVMVAYLIDTETNRVINAASVPLTEKAEQRFTVEDLIKENQSSVDGIEIDDMDAEPVYYNLQGIRLDAPVAGEPVIERRGSSVRKFIAR